MTPSLLSSSTITMLEQVMQFTHRRHAVLAGNIANVDVPGYKSRDLSPEVFQARLREALEGRSHSYGTGGGSEARGTADRELAQVAAHVPALLNHDQSDIGIEQQVTEISKNQFQHNLAVTILNSQFHMLQTAITERLV